MIDISRGRKLPRHREVLEGTESEARTYESILKETFGVEKNTKRYTIEWVWEKYRVWLLSNNRTTNPRGLENRINSLERICTRLGKHPIDRLAIEILVDYREKRIKEIRLRIAQKKGMPVEEVVRGGERTVNLEITYLSGMSTWAMAPERKYAVAHIPKISKLMENVTEPKPLPMPTVRKLLTALDPLHRAMCLLMVQGGLRSYEAFSLKKENIDWERRTCRILGKGSKFRTISMTPMIYNALTTISGVQTGMGLVFPPRKTNKYETRMDIRKSIATARKIAGIQVPVTLHMLRHTFATETLASSRNIKLVKEALGHAKIATTERYSAWLDAQIREMVDETFKNEV
jgi:integrase